MKSSPLTIITALLFFLFLGACSKDSETTPQQSPEEILTSTTWKVDEIRFLQNNTFYYYKRGVTGDVAGMDTEFIKFNSDKTGSYKAGTNTYTLTWDFTNPGKTQLMYIVNYPTPLTVYWEKIKLTATLLDYTEYYNRTGSNSLASATRIP